MVHPAFLNLDNKPMADACSEIFEDNFKFTSTPEIAMKYGEGGFPPVPAHLTTVTAAYLEPNPTTGLTSRVQFVSLQADQSDLVEVAELYTSNVGVFQEMTNILDALMSLDKNQESNLNGIQKVQSWYAEKVTSNGGTLLAAHITARTVDDNQLIDTITFPKVIFSELPLLARENFLELKPQIDEIISDELLEDETKEQINSVAKTFLRNDPILQNLGTIAASTFLPNAELLSQKLLAEKQNISLPAKPGGNRAQRRKKHLK